MKKHIGLFLVALFASAMAAQQPQTQTAPISALNAKYANGTAPGYWPTAGSGLTLNLSGGTAFCSGSVVTYSAGTLTMTASTTNNIYLNTASSCVPAVKTTAFTSSDIPVAQVVTSGSAITGITDVRTLFFNNATGGATTTIASGTSSLGTSAIASATCATVVTTTATGVASTDSVIWNPNASIKAVTGYVPATTGGLSIAGYPTTNAVNWDVCNWTSSSITPGAVTLNWRVVR